MNCDRFLAALETGGFAGRLLARLHAARCPRCAAVRAALAAAKQQLRTCEPLSPRVRQLWRQAAGEASVRSSGDRILLPLAAGLAVAVIVLAFFVSTAVRKEALSTQGKTDVAHSDAAPVKELVAEVDSASELARLAATIDRLDADVLRLRHQAERLEARQQVAMTLDQFGHW